MSRNSSKDVNEKTNPGAAPGADPFAQLRSVDDDQEDEFPAEATRIDQRYGVSAPQPGPRPPAASLESLVAARKAPTGMPEGKRPASASSPSTPSASSASSAKLAALQSLSINTSDSTGSTRSPFAPRGGGSMLPWVLLTLVLGGLGVQQYLQRKSGGGGHANSGEDVTVHTERVVMSGGAGQTLIAAGYAQVRTLIPVGTPTGGLVEKVLVQNNDKIKRGQLIVVFNSSIAQADLAAVHAQVVEAQHALSQTQELYKAQAATMVELYKARSAVSLAKANLNQPEAKIQAAHVKAPSDATVLDVIVHPGETVTPNAPLMKIADLHQLVAEIDITESDINKVHLGQSVDVTSDALPEQLFRGKVREIAAQADKAKGTVQVKVDLQLPDDTGLRPQMSVKGTFQPMVGDKPRVFIPRTALTSTGSVWIVGADRRVTARVVQTGTAQGPSVEVLAGLQGGEEIVSDGKAVHEGQQLALPQPQ